MKKIISLSLILIISIILTISLNNIDYVHGQNETRTQATQINPGTIEPQPLVNTDTGQDVALPGRLIGVQDPKTGQIIAKEVEVIPPKVTGPSAVTTLNGNPLAQTIGDLPNNAAGGPGLGLPGQVSGNEPLLSTNQLLFSTSNPALTTLGNAAPPTFNPPLKKCETGVSDSNGGFDIAKYGFTGNMDKNQLQGDEFAFQIFADLVDGDDYEIEGKDAPYKATMLTDLTDNTDNDNKKINVHLKEIATLCIDTQHAINIEQITQVDLEKSELFKTLEY